MGFIEVFKSKIRGGKLLIKCPKCEAEYSFGRRIVHTCKETTVTQGIIFGNHRVSYRWNPDYHYNHLEYVKGDDYKKDLDVVSLSMRLTGRFLLYE